MYNIYMHLHVWTVGIHMYVTCVISASRDKLVVFSVIIINFTRVFVAYPKLQERRFIV